MLVLRILIAMILRHYIYTNIDHAELKSKMGILIDKMFELKSVPFVCVYESLKTTWCSNKRAKYAFTCSDVKEMLNYLIDNIFVTFKGKIYRQVIGVPMGCDCAPFLANLFLYSFEFDYIKLLHDSGAHCLKKRFQCSSRFIDDLCIPNGGDDFLELVDQIYPGSLKLEKTNASNKRATFLDLDISIINNKFVTVLYDKRKDFDFNVISMPNLKSNIPHKQSYGIFYAQLFRLCNCNSMLDNFVNDVKLLIDKLVKQNFKRHSLINYVKRFIDSKPPITFKFWSELKVNMFM